MFSQILAAAIEFKQEDVSIPKPDLTAGSFDSILQLVFGVLGAVALLIIAIGGLRYVISQGDPQATAKAKNTILYALVGLVICIAAFTIVTFVVGSTQ